MRLRTFQQCLERRQLLVVRDLLELWCDEIIYLRNALVGVAHTFGAVRQCFPSNNALLLVLHEFDTLGVQGLL